MPRIHRPLIAQQPLAALLLDPKKTRHLGELSLQKRIGFISLSVLIGLPTLFLPHLIYLCIRKIQWLTKPVLGVYRSLDQIAQNLKPSGMEKFFFHLHAHRFGKNSALEGGDFTSVLQAMLKRVTKYTRFLPRHRKVLYKGIDKLLESAVLLSRQRSTASYKKTLNKLVRESFAKQQPFLIPGGWPGNPGHAMYYWVIPQGPNHATFRLLNLGGGSDNHPMGKFKQAPNLDWKGVTINRLTDPLVGQALFELMRGPPLEKDEKVAEYSEKDIYVGLRHLLQPTSVESMPQVLMSSQELGICVLKSLMPLFAFILPKAEYKHFQCDFKLDTAVAAAKKGFRGSKLPKEIQSTLIQKALKHTADYIKKQADKGYYPQKIFSKAEKKLHEAFIALQKRKVSSARLPYGRAPYSFTRFGIKNLKVGLQQIASKTNLGQVTTSSIQLLDSIRHEMAQPASALIWQTVSQKIKEAVEQKEGMAIHQAVYEFILAQPITLPAYSFSELQVVQQALSDLGIAYFKSYAHNFERHAIQPEMIFVMRKIFHLQALCNEKLYGVEGGYLFHSNTTHADAFGEWHFTQDADVRAQMRKMANHLPVADRSINLDHMHHIPKGAYHLYDVLAKQFPVYFNALRNAHPNGSKSYLIAQALVNLPDPLKAQAELTQYWHKFLNGYRFRKNVSLDEMHPQYEVKCPTSTKNISIEVSYHFLQKDDPIVPLFGNMVEEDYRCFRSIYLDNHHRDHSDTASLTEEEKKVQAHIGGTKTFFQESHMYPHGPVGRLKNKWSDEEFHLLGRTIPSSHIALNDLLAYCTEHPQAIEHADFCRIFLSILLINGPKGKKYAALKQQVDQLQAWLLQRWEISSKQGVAGVQTSLFILRALQMMTSMAHLPDPDLLKKLNHLKSISVGRKEEGFVHAQILSYFGMQKNVQDFTQFATSVAYLERHSTLRADVDPLLSFEIEKAKLKHGNTLINFFKTQPDAIGTVVHQIYGELSDTMGWSLQKAGTFISTGGDTYEPLQGTIQIAANVGKLEFLPDRILKHPHFQLLFPKVSQAVLIQNDKECYYAFKDPATKRESRVYKDGNITQEIAPHGFCLFIKDELFTGDILKQNPLVSLHLIKNHHQWLTLTSNPRYLLSEDQKTREALFMTTLEGITDDGFHPKKIEDVKTKKVLSMPSDIFHTIEYPYYIEQWHTPNKGISKVDLPRLGLSFNGKEADPKKLWCDEIPGFYLDLENPPLFPIPKFQHGLVLRNHKGEQIYLVSKRQFIADKKQEVLAPAFQTLYSPDVWQKQSVPYFTYAIQADGTLASQSMEGDLYMAYLFSIAQDYRAAATLLRKYQSNLLPFDDFPQFESILLGCLKLEQATGDSDANAISIQLQAGNILLQNAILYATPQNQGKIKKYLATLHLNYLKYLKKLHHVTEVPFDKQEELILLDLLLGADPKDELLIHRRNALLNQPSELKDTFTLTTSSTAPKPDKNMASDIMNLVFTNSSKKRVEYSITRLPFQQYFKKYYNWARHGTEEQKQYLKSALFFISSSSSAAHFLRVVLEHPDLFEDVPHTDEAHKWAKKQVEQYDSIISHIKDDKELKRKEEIIQIPSRYFPQDLAPLEPIRGKISFKVRKLIQNFTKKCLSFFTATEMPALNLQPLKDYYKSISTTTNTMLQGVIRELEADCEFFEKRSKDKSYKIKSIAKLEHALQSSAESRLSALESRLVKRANLEMSQASFIDKVRGNRRPISIKDLVVNFGKQRPDLLQFKNPYLKSEDIQAIYTDLAEYLLLATEEDKRKRAHSALQMLKLALKKEPKDDEEIYELTQTVANTILTERAYTLDHNDPKTAFYLVFEFGGDLIIRKDQLELVDAFRSSGNVNPIKEMIMGSGKSKVISPMLALLRADGKNLSALIVDAKFAKDVSMHTHDVIYEGYEQSLVPVHFDRDTPITVANLQIILQKLQRMIHNQDVAILTSKSYQCLMMRFAEEHFKWTESSVEELPTHLVVMQEILKLLRDPIYPNIDEADTVLQVRETRSLSRGTQMPIDSDYQTVLTNLYRLLYFDTQLKQIAQLETDPNPTKGIPALTKDIYKQQLKRTLAKKYLEMLPTLKFSKPEIETVLPYLQTLTDNAPLLDYLCQDPKMEPARYKTAKAAFNALPDALKPLVELAGDEIGSLLESTLLKPYKIKYGLHPSSLAAIPFAAANVPKLRSNFTHPLITWNCTIQAYFKEGIQTELIRHHFENMFNRLETSPEDAKESGLNELADKWAKWLYPVPLKARDAEGWQNITDAINNNYEHRFAWICDFIIPQMVFFTEKITSTPQNLASFPKRKTGFTGSLWNGSTMHHSLTPQIAPGDLTKTLAILFSKANHEAIVVDEEDPEHIIDVLKQRQINYDMMCDAGGYFKKLKDRQAADLMANKLNKPVVFYDNETPSITDGKQVKLFKHIPGQEGSRLTFLPQAFTTGADITQTVTATAVLTIGQNMLHRALAQAIWRLRKVDKGQKVVWLLSKNVIELIRAELKLPADCKMGLPEIVTYCLTNTAERRSPDNYTAFLQQLTNEKQQAHLDILLSDAPPSEKKAANKKFKKSWVTRDAVEPTTGVLRTEVDTQKAIRQHAAETSVMLTGDSVVNVNKIVERFSQPGMLPEKVLEPHILTDDTMEVERETEKETERETTLESEEDGDLVTVKLKYYGYFNFEKAKYNKDTGKLTWDDHHPTFNFGEYLTLHKDYQDPSLAKAFADLDVSLNFLENRQRESKKDLWAQVSSHMYDRNREKTVPMDELSLYKKYQKPLDYIYLHQGQITLISQEDADSHIHGSKDGFIYSLKSQKWINRENYTFTDQEQTAIVKAKFLAGISMYNNKEFTILSNWIKQNDKTTLRKFYEDKVLKCFTSRWQQYNGSKLQALLTSNS